MTDLRPHIKAHGTAGVVQRDGRKPLFVCVNKHGEIAGVDADGNTRHWEPEGAYFSLDYEYPIDLLPVEPPAAGQPVGYADEGSLDRLRKGFISGTMIWRERIDGGGVPLYTAPAGDELVALRRLLTTAKMLQQNAEGCAVNHYSGDFELHGLPGWLVDTRADIEAAEALLAKRGGGE